MNKLITFLMLIMISLSVFVAAESDNELSAEESTVESSADESSNDSTAEEQEDDDESDSVESDEDSVARDSEEEEKEDEEQAIPEEQESEESSVDSDNENDETEEDEEDEDESEDDDLEDVPEKDQDFASFDNMDVEDENDDDVWDIEDMDETLSEAKEAYSNMNADAELEKNKAAGLVRATESITLDGQKVDIGDEDLATKMMQDIYTNEQQTNEEINDMDEASRSAAYIAAELSADVYENTKIGKYKTIKGQRYYVRYRFTHNKSGANAAIYENGNNIYLVFEGTKNEWRLKDWKTNLKINKKSCIARDGDNYGKCHSGFRDSYNLIASLNNDQLMKAVKAYKAKGRRLTLTGHSLGGALATMAALDIKARSGYGRNFDIITFGSPRVGDSTFIRKWDANFGARSDRYVMEFKAGTCPFSDNHGTRVEDDVEDSDFWRRRRRRRRGGFFKKVGKGISKAAKKVAKGVKKVAKGVAKVAKKVVKAVVGKKRTGRDLVTRIPPKSFGFSHVIREKILTSKHSCSLYCCHKYNILLMIKVHAIKDYAALLK